MYKPPLEFPNQIRDHLETIYQDCLETLGPKHPVTDLFNRVLASDNPRILREAYLFWAKCPTAQRTRIHTDHA